MIGLIIQARMNSKRFPGKVLAKIGTKTLLEYIFFRLSFLQYPLKVILATTDTVNDDVIEAFCVNNNLKCFRGNENNVLERYYYCAKLNNFDHIIRLTADNPFIDIEELEKLIYLHLESNADSSSSCDFLPIGMGAEIIKFDVLEYSYYNSYKPEHYEHVNEYIFDNKSLFYIENLDVIESKRRPDVSVTVDTQEDYQKVCYIINNSNKEYVDTMEIIRLSDKYLKESG